MKAGAMREFLDFYEMRETTSPSGAFKRDWVKVFSRRAMFKRSRPVYDKDGLKLVNCTEAQPITWLFAWTMRCIQVYEWSIKETATKLF